MAKKVTEMFDKIKSFFQSAQSELSMLRDKIAATTEAVQDLESRPIDLAAAQTKLRDAIAGAGKTFAEREFRTMPFLNEASPLHALELSFRGVDQFQLACFLMPEQVEKQMQPVIAEFLERYPGVSPTERAAKLVELRATLRALETEEELLISEGQKVGLRIPRRAGASPEIVLGE